MEAEASPPDKTVPIAIIGMACRFPGDGTNTEKLFEMLQKGVSAWSEFPEDRVNIDGFYHPSGNREGSIPFRGAHFLKGDVSAFDASFFNISANEAKAIDPQQRVLLEVTYEALENAGVPVESIDGSETSVNVGSFVKDYEQIVLRDPDWSPQYAATGTGAAILANRISHSFNLMGPSQTIDTGCSGSLVAVHNCCLDLQTGRSSLAIAAGVGMILTPATMMPMTALNFLSPDGKCFTFSEKANGYGRGEGVGVVVLKRLDDALRDNDTIRAVIRGSRTNQDGRTPGITMPSSESQLCNIRAVYDQAGLDVGQTAFVECHGTGTQAGDPKEVKAIYRAFCENRTRDQPIVVGSIKPNVGHLEGAAGVAGLIKATLSVERGVITKNLHFEPPGNPAIPFGEWNVQVPTETMPWPLPGLRRASVNCFGFGGSNCHIIIDDAHHYLQQRSLSGKHQSAPAAGESSGPRSMKDKNAVAGKPLSSHLFVFSSHEKSGIRRIVEAHLDYVRQNITTPEKMADYAYTLSCRRSRLEYGAFVVATDPKELPKEMERLAADSSPLSAPETPPRVALVFCGQGAQWHAMGRELMQWPVFRRSIVDASEYLTSLGSTFSLHDELLADARATRIGRPRIAQPATTAVQIALVELLRAFGVVPVATVGHSSGEIAAAYAAGHLSREDAWKVAFRRGHHVASAWKSLAGRQGAMLAAGLSPADAQPYLDAVSEGSVCIACYNSPSSVTLSGDQDQVRAIQRQLQEQGVFNRVLHVPTAYHSPHMKGVGAAYRESIADVAPRAGHAGTEMFSSSRCWQNEKPGAALHGSRSLRGRSSELDADYWAQNLVEPVYFDSAFEQMCRKHKPDVVIEVSPSAALRRSVQEITSKMAPSRPAVPCVPMLEKNKHAARTTLTAMGELWARGYPIDLLWPAKRSDGSLPQALVDMLPYPWNHSRSYWHESHLGRALRFRKHGREDLIGALTADSSPREPRWRGFFRLSENPWMQDHQVQKTVVYPAAGMIVMALEAAKQSADPGMDVEGYEITDFAIVKPVVIPTSDHGLEHALNAKALRIAADDGGHASTYSFTIYTKPLDAPWQENAHGALVIRYRPDNDDGASRADEAAFYRRSYDDVLSRCEEELTPRHLYEKLDIIGMNYGPLFQNITRVKRSTGKCCATAVKVPNTKDKMPAKYEYDHVIHPATLDAIFQTVFAVGEEAMVPSTCRSIYLSNAMPRGAGHQLFGYATAERKGLRGATAEIVMAGEQWDKPLVVVKGLDFTSLAATREDSGFLPSHRNLCSEIVWAQDIQFATPDTMQDFLCLLAYKRPDLKILQVDQDAMLAYEVLSVLGSGDETPMLSGYTVLSDSDSVVSEMMRMDTAERWGGVLGHAATLEEGARYDVVLVSTDTDRDPSDIARHLAPDCTVLLSAPGPGREFDTTIAVALDEQTRTEGLRTHSHLVRRVPTGVYCFITTKRPGLIQAYTKEVVILVNGSSAGQVAIARELSSKLEGAGLAVSIRTLDAGVDEGTLYISLLDIDLDEPFLFTVNEGDFKALHGLLLRAGGLLWVASGSQMLVDNPRAAPFHALARTIRSEDASKMIVTLDIDADRPSCLAPCDLIADLFCSSLLAADTRVTPEAEHAERQGRVFIPRLRPLSRLNRVIEVGPDHARDLYPVTLSEAPRPLKMSIGAVGDFASIYFDEDDAPDSLGSSEVLISVEETRLLPEDLETMLGKTSRDFIGTDVLGTVVAVGSHLVDGSIQPGARVVALAPGTMKQRVKVDRQFVQPAGPDPFTSPSAALAAYYALHQLGDLSEGETVFIHAAASVYGQAALRYAKSIGAVVIAGAAGEQKSHHLRAMRCGLEADMIVDTGRGDFPAAVLRLTAGKGADVVFNPSPDNVDGCIECAGAHGHIIQLAHHSLPGARPSSRPTPTYHVWDLWGAVSARPKALARAFAAAPRLPPALPTVAHDLGDLQRALEALRGDPFVGEHVVRVAPGSRVNAAVKAVEPVRLDPKATYVLVGGLGGLGRSVARLLAEKGARHLAFLSRSAGSGEGGEFVRALRGEGVDAQAFPVDVCDLEALRRALAAVEEKMPAIKGAVQAAAVLKDAVFENLRYEDWEAATRPKTVGSWNLHQALPTGMDFLVFLSSAAGVIGNRGQASYAAGNGFQDALAMYRSRRGLPSVSLDLGPVLGAGMVAEDDRTMDVLRGSGFFGLRLEDFHFLVDRAMAGRAAAAADAPRLPAQVVSGVGTGGLMVQNQPADPYWTRTRLFSHLNQVDLPPPAPRAGLAPAPGSAPADLQAALRAAADPAAAARAVCAGLVTFLARSLNMPAADLDEARALGAYGVDSLVATNIRGWVFRSVGVRLTDLEVMGAGSIAELARTAAEKAGSGGRGGGGA